MIGTLVSVGGGLVLGISLLFWSLRERSRRHAAELALKSSRHLVKGKQEANERLRTEIAVIRKDRDNCQAQLQVLRDTVLGLHEKLAKCKDPAAIEQLLNDELGEQL